MLDFEGNSESFILGILRLCYEISNMLVEADNTGFVFDKDFNCFFTCEFDSLTGWYL